MTVSVNPEKAALPSTSNNSTLAASKPDTTSSNSIVHETESALVTDSTGDKRETEEINGARLSTRYTNSADSGNTPSQRLPAISKTSAPNTKPNSKSRSEPASEDTSMARTYSDADTVSKEGDSPNSARNDEAGIPETANSSMPKSTTSSLNRNRQAMLFAFVWVAVGESRVTLSRIGGAASTV